MEYRDLKTQYKTLKNEIDQSVEKVFTNSNFIMGNEVKELEEMLAEYVGVKHCITCANGTDALFLTLKAWGIKEGDCVFVADFTFFSSCEVVSALGATPYFVDVCEDTFNIDTDKLEKAIQFVLEEGKLTPKAIVAVDLFGLCADYEKINGIAKKYNLKVLEDGAQGFGGKIKGKTACSFGNAGTTSFFPAKPLGCYGDGGAVFTDNDEDAQMIKSLKIHGKGQYKYDNVRIGINSRLDTVQAAILKVKFKAFNDYELNDINVASQIYTEQLKEIVKCPIIKKDFYSSWAQYTIQLKNEDERNNLQKFLKDNNIPSMVYYPIPMHKQTVYKDMNLKYDNFEVSTKLSKTVLSLPIHPYIKKEDIINVCNKIKEFLKH